MTDHIANMVPVQTMTGGFGRVQSLVVLADVGDSLMPPPSVARGVTDYDHTSSVRRRVTAGSRVRDRDALGHVWVVRVA